MSCPKCGPSAVMSTQCPKCGGKLEGFGTKGAHPVKLKRQQGPIPSLTVKAALTNSTDAVKEFLREHRYDFEMSQMLEHSNSLDYWKTLWEAYGDLGGNLCPDGTKVRTPWAGPPPEYWGGDAQGEVAMNRYLKKKKKPRTDSADSDEDSVREFLRQHGRDGFIMEKMLEHSASMESWKELWETYGDLGGHMCQDGTRVRTPWAGPPPEYWSGGEQGEAAMQQYLKANPGEAVKSEEREQGYAISTYAVKEFLREHRYGLGMRQMLEYSNSLDYWKTLWETYGDLGGNLCPDGTRVRTPWAGPPPEYWSGDAQGEVAMNRYLKKKKPRTDSANSEQDCVREFLRQHGRDGFIMEKMLEHSASLEYWKELWETYGDLGGHMCQDGTRVRTPWAGPPPEYWSGGEQGEAAMKRYLKAKPSNAVQAKEEEQRQSSEF